jgi:HD superfamily phosphohydrolase
MQYIDKVYGENEINEPVILDLINSKALQRLKGINQAGYLDPFSPGGPATITRFEHSLGVFLLLKKYRASLDEQIAGLIHDVSHSAFSHCIDYVLDSGSGKEQDHQDNIFANFVKNSDIPKISEKYSLDLDYILDDLNFPLKERDLPDLCADRIDYSLRTSIDFGDINQGEAKIILDNLIADKGRWIFKDFESGKKFAELFYLQNEKYYAGPASAAMFITVGDCLKYALEKKYIFKEDFYETDEVVLNKIKSNLKNDEKLNNLFLRMNAKIPFKVNLDPSGRIFCKSRVVDPLVLENGEIKRVSDIDKSWREKVRRESEPKQYLVEFTK